MKVAIAGISGFVGKHLHKYLLQKGYEVVPVSRAHFRLSVEELAAYFNGVDAVINLSGSPVIKRWTKKNRKEILNSRIETTARLIDVFNIMKQRPSVFINASAIGIYSYRDSHDEKSVVFGDNFLAEIVQQWENAALGAKEAIERVCIARLGVVFGAEGGAFPKLVLPFKWGVGGRIGNGKQAVSFIHINDVVRAFEHLLTSNSASGIYNFTAPNYTTNGEMSKVLASSLGKPMWLTVPVAMLKIIYGKASQVIVGGEKVIPKRLLDEGFTFNFSDITTTVNDLL